MITVTEVKQDRLEYLIRLAYLGDDEGIYKFHVEPLDYEDGVKKTLDMIETMEKVFPMRYFQVNYKGMPIGYFVFYEVLLYSFGINIVYRTKRDVLSQWWNRVTQVMGNDFAVVLQNNNTRAISFLKRFGMKEVSPDLGTDNLITLVNNI